MLPEASHGAPTTDIVHWKFRSTCSRKEDFDCPSRATQLTFHKSTRCVPHIILNRNSLIECTCLLSFLTSLFPSFVWNWMNWNEITQDKWKWRRVFGRAQRFWAAPNLIVTFNFLEALKCNTEKAKKILELCGNAELCIALAFGTRKQHSHHYGFCASVK